MYKIFKLLICSLLSITFNNTFSQVVIDCYSWGSNQCNAFYQFPPILNFRL